MMETLNKPQKIFMIIMYVLASIGILVSSFVIYNLVNVMRPETLGVTYASTLNSSSGEEPICTVEIWSNDNNNGQQLYEILWNSYTDEDGQGIKGFGVQIVGDYFISHIYEMLQSIESSQKISKKASEFKNTILSEETIVCGDWYCYNTDDLGESSYMLPIDKVGRNLYISIDDNFYQIKLNNYSWQTDESFWIFSHKYVTHYAPQTFFDLTDYVIQSALTDSAKKDNSTFYIDLLECANFYDLLYKDSRGQYHPLQDATDIKNYLQIKVNYHKDGATESSDSMFKQVAYSTTWSFYDNSNLEEYWNAYGQIEITENHLNFVYNKDRQAYYATIDEKLAKYLESTINTEISVKINFDNLDFNVYGIDLKNFTFKIESFDITSTANTDDTFVVYNSKIPNISPTIHLGGAE